MDYQAILEEIQREVEPRIGDGRVADYIPALAQVRADRFGMALRTVTGELFQVGDAAERFSIQSISKVFTLTMALGLQGERLFDRVGREPSGTPFNSLVQLELENGQPRNPLINAGALLVADVLLDCLPDARRAVLDFVRRRSLAMSCAELAAAFQYLAQGGRDPATGERLLTSSLTKRTNALLLTCGVYDAAGDFAYRVGLPGKSGVGGGIVAVMPDEWCVAVWSPALDPSGNSLAGTLALELLTTKTGTSIF